MYYLITSMFDRQKTFRILKLSDDKNRIFKFLHSYEDLGVMCMVIDEEGEVLS